MSSILRASNAKTFAALQVAKVLLPCHALIRQQHTINNSESGDKSDIYDPNKHIPLVFLRHGQSTWNQKNIFIGMNDTPLTTDGIHEAQLAGSLLATNNFHPDIVYTSLLRRSTKTVWIVMQELGLEWVPVVKVSKRIVKNLLRPKQFLRLYTSTGLAPQRT